MDLLVLDDFSYCVCMLVFRRLSLEVDVCASFILGFYQSFVRFTFNDFHQFQYSVDWCSCSIASLIFYWLCHLLIDKNRINLIEPFYCDLLQPPNFYLLSHKIQSRAKEKKNYRDEDKYSVTGVKWKEKKCENDRISNRIWSPHISLSILLLKSFQCFSFFFSMRSS